jgi:hypothetical protein
MPLTEKDPGSQRHKQAHAPFASGVPVPVTTAPEDPTTGGEARVSLVSSCTLLTACGLTGDRACSSWRNGWVGI